MILALGRCKRIASRHTRSAVRFDLSAQRADVQSRTSDIGHASWLRVELLQYKCGMCTTDVACWLGFALTTSQVGSKHFVVGASARAGSAVLFRMKRLATVKDQYADGALERRTAPRHMCVQDSLHPCHAE